MQIVIFDAPACPFCGEAMVELKASGDREAPPYWVECPKCGACGPPDDTQQGAVDSWGERYQMPDPAQKVPP